MICFRRIVKEIEFFKVVHPEIKNRKTCYLAYNSQSNDDRVLTFTEFVKQGSYKLFPEFYVF